MAGAFFTHFIEARLTVAAAAAVVSLLVQHINATTMSAALMASVPAGLGRRATPLVASSSSTSACYRRAQHATMSLSSSSSSSSITRRFAVSPSSRGRVGARSISTTITAASGGGPSTKKNGSERFRRAESSFDSASNGNGGPNNDDDESDGVSLEQQQDMEMRLGRAAMLGFFFTTVVGLYTG
jgi:hypothetical protein